jgi:hypothetical protein
MSALLGAGSDTPRPSSFELEQRIKRHRLEGEQWRVHLREYLHVAVSWADDPDHSREQIHQLLEGLASALHS